MNTATAIGVRSVWAGRLPGIACAAALAVAAGWVAGGLGDPLARNPVLVAMLAGLGLGAIFGCPASLRPGLDFTKRTLLRTGVALLGFRITAALLVDLGPIPIAIAASELLIVLVTVRWVARRVLRMDADLALLIAVGSAVCGAAAILSFASLSKPREKHAGTAVTVITLAGTLALLAYPVLYLGGWMPGLDDQAFGVSVGSSIFELAQVYGASASVSEGALNAATLVKLSKVLMLIPLLMVAGGRPASGAAARPVSAFVPWFVLAFIAVVALNSSITLHPQVRATLLGTSQFFFMMTTVALGLTTSMATMRAASGGPRLLAIAAVALAVSSGTAYALTRLFAAPAAAAITAAGDARIAQVAGARVFDDLGCAKCHVPSLHGRRGEITLYSDLLLHDMGPALDDKIVQGDASGSEWRTTPLVGLGTHQRYLHDGRATSLREAVQAHGGEAEVAKQRFLELDGASLDELYAFLSKL
jgi:uncharacterized integral membrane protein (TIGR00698 family)